MTGEKLYPRKSRVYFFIFVYGVLAVAGGVLSVQPVLRDQGPGGAAGFMLIFGVGMLVQTIIKSRKPLVTVYEDLIELSQSRKKEFIRFRHVVGVSQPDNKRLVVTLREHNVKENVTIWLRDIERSDAKRLYEFLAEKARVPK
ncbi:MAG TPA: hypothetical protein VN328_00435 [Thermodesulfovibrionales bacterium]|nr:hypothetical protein [Thermodesulfovibrionales bacterium]